MNGARTARIWYGPVTFYQQSEPFMTIAVAGNRKAVGIAVAEINLKLIWDVISAIRVGAPATPSFSTRRGSLIAHPDIGLVLRGANDQTSAAMRRLRETLIASEPGKPITTKSAAGKTVVVAMAPHSRRGLDRIRRATAVGGLRADLRALWRTGGLLLAGAAFAATLAYWLARRMTGPIRRLEEGAERIGTGQFDHRIEISTGDELERLADTV